MKKILLFILFALGSMPLLMSQVGKNNLKLSLSRLSHQELNLAYERVVEPGVSIEIRPSYFLENKTAVNDEGYKQSGYGIDAELKFFFQHEPEAPIGFYLTPFFMSSFYNETEDVEGDADVDRIIYLQYGLAIGYQTLLSKRFVLDANLGSHRNDIYDKELELSDSYDELFDGFYTPRLSLSVGYNF